MQQLPDVLYPIFILFWFVHSCLAIEINFVKFVCFISLASVQIYIQVVPLCDVVIILENRFIWLLNKVFLIQRVEISSYFKEINFLT